MIQLTVPDMACSACVERIEAAIAALDTQATIETHLEAKQVRVSSQLSDAEIRQAISSAGYTPT